MAAIHQSIGQFRAAEQRLPGYFTVKDMGNEDNVGATLPRGLTYMENALLDLGGGLYDDQSASADDPSDPNKPPDLIEVGIGPDQGTQQIIVQRSAIGRTGGPGYLDIPEGFVNMGSNLSGSRMSSFESMLWMPHLVDAWGMPILMWPRDEFAGSSAPMAERDSDARRARFYWAGNAGFTMASAVGRDAPKSQITQSTLSDKTKGGIATAEQLIDSLAAVVGHPSFPDPTTLDAATGPEPAESRGDVVLHSAGTNGIFLETKSGLFTHYHYMTDGVDLTDSSSWLTETTSFLEKSDDISQSGS